VHHARGPGLYHRYIRDGYQHGKCMKVREAVGPPTFK
jgi:hypothetical protein